MHFSYMNLLWVMMTNICTLLNMWGHHSRDQYAYILIALWKMEKLKFLNNCHHIHTMICNMHLFKIPLSITYAVNSVHAFVLWISDRNKLGPAFTFYF